MLLTAVQYGHIMSSSLSSADNCLIARGGSASLLLDSNDVMGCGTRGIALGDAAAFQSLPVPWLQYEAYNVRATNNVVRNVSGAARVC